MSYKISGLSSLADPAADDLLLVVDVSDTSTPPAGAGGSDKKTTVGALLALAGGGGVARIFGAGHSYMAGYLNAEGGQRYITRLAAALGAEEVTYAISGAVLAEDSTGGQPGGYANVLCGLSPRVFSGGSYAVRNAAPYLPVSPVVVFDYGVNDLAWLTATTATNITWFTMALTACCCIARAGGWFPDTDASVAYSSGWTANTGNQESGWPTDHSATATGRTVTITVPADFPGGEIDLLSITDPTLSPAGGTKWSTVVDGGSAQVLDGTGSAYGAVGNQANLVVQRLTGLAAGTHTIVMTVSALDSGGKAFFQGWLAQAPAPWTPNVILVNQPVTQGIPLTVAGAAHSPVTSADIGALNTAITAVAAAFTDGRVVVADVASACAALGGATVAYGSPGALWASDNFHPGVLGHAVFADTVLAAISSAPPLGAALASPEGVLWRVVGGPLEPAFSANWSASGGYALFGKDRAGNGLMRWSAVLKSAAGVFKETVFTLPPGYQPNGAGGSAVAGLALTTSETVAAYAVVVVQDTGAVQWLAGTPTEGLVVSGSWPADGLGS